MNLFDYLKECNDNIGEITITPEFIEYRNEYKDKFNANGRTNDQRLMHADCLIIEYMFLENEIVTKPETIKYDFGVGDNKIDCKVIKDWFNVPAGYDNYYTKNIAANQLTHFAFFRYKTAPTRPLVAGDKISFNLIKVDSAINVLSKLRPSKYPDKFTGKTGYYYNPN